MDDRERELQRHLPGLEEGMPEVFKKLAEIFQYQVFELCRFELCEGGEYLIPYMMNDAIEDYLILKECRMIGEYLRKKECVTAAHLAVKEDGYVLSVRQGEENAFTLHFSEIEERIRCYQYHNIGHFWVNGQEHWRQLVYIIGTIYEKYDYMGEAFCNDAEKELKDLAEFSPFCMWSPISESLEGKYPATYEGIACMERFARKAGDKNYVRLLKFYRRYPSQFLEKLLSRRLLSPGRQKLYDKIWEQVRKASEVYQERDYGQEMNLEIEKKRREVQEMLSQKGFEGMYPEYYSGQIQITVTEEHPFTIMEFDDFVFRIQFMVSECKKHVKMGRNCGFFRGIGRKGRIVRTTL